MIPILGIFDDYTGFGVHTTELVSELLKLIDVRVCPVSWKYYSGLPEGIQKVRKAVGQSSWHLLIHPLFMDRTLAVNSRTAFWTMCESTRIPMRCVRDLNTCKVVITSSAWCASTFSSSGVDKPIRVVPQGLNLDRYPVTEQPSCDVFVFGADGRHSHGGIRKGAKLVVEAFQKAFPDNKDVRLELKSFSRDPIVSEDPRIVIWNEYFSPLRMAEWYRGINAFVSGCSCEGWGLHQHEAMASGRPVIGVHFGGVTEFFNPINGYAVEFDLAPGEGIYHDKGHYPRLKVGSLAEQMRLAYSDRPLLDRKSKLAAASARRFTSEFAARKLIETLKEVRLL